MKIAIVGASGFIGKHLSRALKIEHELLLLDSDNFDLTKLDANNKTLRGKDVVINLVGQFQPPFDRQLSLNVLAPQKLAENCAFQKVGKLIHISASAVSSYDTTYALSKKLGEEVLAFYQKKYGLPIIIFRPPNVYGPGSNHGVVYNFYKSIKDKGKVTIFGDGKQTRDFLYVSDLVEVIKKAFAYKKNFEIFEVGGGREYSLLDLVSSFENALGKKIPIDFKDADPLVSTKVTARSNLAQKHLGWSAKVDLNEGIKEIVK